MELVLLRHAEAEDYVTSIDNDLQRKLTKKGINQAKVIDNWLNTFFPKDYDLFVSEAIRSKQTAKYLNNTIKINPIFNPNADYKNILKFIQKNITKKNIIIVGHQPWIGFVANILLYNFNEEHLRQEFFYHSIKKATLYWFSTKELNSKIIYNLTAKISSKIISK